MYFFQRPLQQNENYFIFISPKVIMNRRTPPRGITSLNLYWFINGTLINSRLNYIYKILTICTKSEFTLRCFNFIFYQDQHWLTSIENKSFTMSSFSCSWWFNEDLVKLFNIYLKLFKAFKYQYTAVKSLFFLPKYFRIIW